MTDPFVREDVRRFLDLVAANPRPQLGSVPIDESRTLLRASQPLIEAEARAVGHVEDMHYDGPGGRLAMRYYDDREQRLAAPLILFIHGGGFSLFDIDHYDAAAREIARHTQLPVVSIDYRLAPENPFPAAPDDCEAAARLLGSQDGPLPFVPAGLVLAGDSGGGNLAIVTALALALKPAAIPVIALAPIYPAVSGHDRSPSMIRFAEGYMLDRTSLKFFVDSYAAPSDDPRYHVLDRDLSILPPTVLMTASLDPLRDQGAAFAERLRAAGVDVRHYEAEGNIHGLITYRKIVPSSQDDLDQYLDLLVASLKEHGHV